MFSSSTASTDLDRATLFNKFFHSVFTASAFDLPSTNHLAHPSISFPDISITPLEVLNTVHSLDPSKSMGIDNMGPKLLHNCALALYLPIHHLFTSSLETGVVSSEWKLHIISPIHKSGDKSKVNNYRPISLLCSLSKVLERIIFNYLSKWLTHNCSL